MEDCVLDNAYVWHKAAVHSSPNICISRELAPDWRSGANCQMGAPGSGECSAIYQDARAFGFF